MNTNIELLQYAQQGDLITVSERTNFKDSIQYVSLYDVIEIIRSGKNSLADNPFEESLINKISKIRNTKDSEERQNLKKDTLPVFYITGCFMGRCVKENLKYYSRWSCLDIDNYDFSKYQEVVDKLKSLKYVAYIFSSPSSPFKMKVIFQHNLSNENFMIEYRNMYLQVCKEIEELVGFRLFDTCCQNIDRPCYFSVGLIYENDEVEPYQYIHQEKPQNFKTQVINYNSVVDINDCGGGYIEISCNGLSTKCKSDKLDDYIFKDIKRIIKDGVYGALDINRNSYVYNYKEGQRDNYCFYCGLFISKYITDMNNVIRLFSEYLEKDLLVNDSFEYIKPLTNGFNFNKNTGEFRDQWLQQFIVKRNKSNESRQSLVCPYQRQ